MSTLLESYESAVPAIMVMVVTAVVGILASLCVREDLKKSRYEAYRKKRNQEVKHKGEHYRSMNKTESNMSEKEKELLD